MSLKTFFRLCASAACLIVIANSCAPVADTKAEAEKIRDLENQWTLANNAMDVEKVMSLFAADAVMLTSGGPVCMGTEAIRIEISKEFADASLDWKSYVPKIDVIYVSASGDLAYARGSSVMKIKTSSGTVDDLGKWIDIWKKVDKQWKVAENIWNSDAPSTAAQTSATVTAEFLKIENDWNEAVRVKDAKALDLLYAPDYTFSDGTGKVYNKRQDIREVLSPGYQVLSPSVISGLTAEVFGDIAVVKGQINRKVKLNGKDLSGTFRFIDVFEWRDGRWQCVSSQAARNE